MADDGGKGASESLNLTITEIMRHLEDDNDRPEIGLRPFLHEKIGDLAEHWYRRGFSRGHMESHKEFLDSGEVPDVLRFECRRKLSPNENRAISLKSKIRKKKKARAKSRKKAM